LIYKILIYSFDKDLVKTQLINMGEKNVASKRKVLFHNADVNQHCVAVSK